MNQKLKIYTLLMLCFFSVQVIGQKRVEQKLAADSAIRTLKDGALLVRLQTRQQTINMLKAKGYPKKAAYFEEKQAKEHQEILEAFKSYSFSDVYYFYSQHSDSIKSGFTNGYILDSALKPVNVTLDKYYIAAIGNLPNKFETEPSTQAKNKQKSETAKEKKYTGGKRLDVKSMYIMDKNFIPLAKPFPIYQRYHPIILTTLTHQEVVSKLDEKFVKFYNNIK